MNPEKPRENEEESKDPSLEDTKEFIFEETPREDMTKREFVKRENVPIRKLRKELRRLEKERERIEENLKNEGKYTKEVMDDWLKRNTDKEIEDLRKKIWEIEDKIKNESKGMPMEREEEEEQ